MDVIVIAVFVTLAPLRRSGSGEPRRTLRVTEKSINRSAAVSTEANKALVRQYITRVFENLDESAVDELTTDDVLMHSIPGAAPGRQPLKDAMTRVRGGLSNVSMRIDELIAEDDIVVARLTAHARQSGEFMGLPPSNKEYTAPEMHQFTIKNGRIAEHWAVVDFMSIMKQLGALPEQKQGKAGAAPAARPVRERRRKAVH